MVSNSTFYCPVYGVHTCMSVKGLKNHTSVKTKQQWEYTIISIHCKLQNKLKTSVAN